MKPTIIFYTNCQGQGLVKLLARQQEFGYHEFVFLAAWQHIRPSQDQIDHCQVLIYQKSFGAPHFLPELPAGAIKIVIPLITCAFMWPYTFDRPNEKVGWRFPYGDRKLIAKTQGDAAPETIATDYFFQDLTLQMDFDRLLLLEFQKWEKYDRDSDVRIGNFLKNNIFRHRLFFTPDHPTDIVMIELANQLLDQLNLPHIEIPDWSDHQHSLAGTEVPVHPSIIRHFAVPYLAEDHQHPLWGGYKSLDTLSFYVSYCKALRAPSMDEALQEAVNAVFNHDVSTAFNICGLISLRYPMHPWAMTVLALIAALNGQREMACQLIMDALPNDAEVSQKLT